MPDWEISAIPTVTKTNTLRVVPVAALLILNMKKEIFTDDCNIKTIICRDVPAERLYEELEISFDIN
jgi:hypothetical protein